MKGRHLLTGIVLFVFSAAANKLDELNHAVTDEEIVDQDMLLPPGTDVDSFFVPLSESGGSVTEASSSPQHAAVKMKERLWSLPVPFQIHSSIEMRKRNVILEAISEITSKTCITFRERVVNDTDYIIFVGHSIGCYSYVGRITGMQPISMGPGCGTKRIAVHEIKHALGFIHEQSRPDRNKSVTIQWNNIKVGREVEFRKAREDLYDSLGVDYDFESVMHYKRYAFSRNGLPTITRNDGSQAEFGQPADGGLSEKDALQVNILYKCNSTGQWSPWVYGPCNQTCGGGTRFAYRSCSGGVCDGDHRKSEECNTKTCDGIWSPWNTGSCSKSCGGGTRLSYRVCLVGVCKGNNMKSEACNAEKCKGIWSPWVDSSCTRTCGGGIRYSFRVCFGGVCEGNDKKSKVCNTEKCKGTWTPWYTGRCSKSCGGGTRWDSRNCFGGVCEGPNTKSEPCNTNSCGGGGGGGGCFPENAFVRNDKGAKVMMKDLTLGEKVLTMDGNGLPVYSPITMMLHRETNRTTRDFVAITTNNGRHITMTSYHLIPLATKEFVFAKDVKSGESLTVFNEINDGFHFEEVVSVNTVTATGFYAPLSNEGTIVVNDVHVSCYALFPSHFISHLLFSIWRSLYANFETLLSQRTDTDGVHWYPSMLKSAATYFHIL